MLLPVNSLAVDVTQRHLNAKHVDLSLHASIMIGFLPWIDIKREALIFMSMVLVMATVGCIALALSTGEYPSAT